MSACWLSAATSDCIVSLLAARCSGTLSPHGLVHGAYPLVGERLAIHTAVSLRGRRSEDPRCARRAGRATVAGPRYTGRRVTGFTPTSETRQNTLCTGPNDIVLFTPQFGAPLPPAPSTGPAAQAVFDAQGQVLSVGAPGGTLPAGASAVQAIGADAAWLTAHVVVGQTLRVFEQLRTSHGTPFALDPQTSIASAGPVLVRNGHNAIDAVDEGVLDPRDLNDYTFSAYRHARTFVGVDHRGRVLLATADGIPDVSAGLTLTEEANLMRSLG